MSLIESAPATMPATSAGTSTLDWRPGSPDALTWQVASPANPARAARATSGANPAHDTRFRRDPSILPRAEKQEETPVRSSSDGCAKVKA